MGYKLDYNRQPSDIQSLSEENGLTLRFDEYNMFIGKLLSDDFINDGKSKEFDIEHLISDRRYVQEQIYKVTTDEDVLKEIDNQVTPKIYTYATNQD